MQGDLLNQVLEQNANSGIKAQGPAAQKQFQVIRSSELYTLACPYACYNTTSLFIHLSLFMYALVDSLNRLLMLAAASVQELSQNRMVSQINSQAPTLSSTETTNADSPLDKTSEQVRCSEHLILPCAATLSSQSWTFLHIDTHAS